MSSPLPELQHLHFALLRFEKTGVVQNASPFFLDNPWFIKAGFLILPAALAKPVVEHEHGSFVRFYHL